MIYLYNIKQQQNEKNMAKLKVIKELKAADMEVLSTLLPAIKEVYPQAEIVNRTYAKMIRIKQGAYLYRTNVLGTAPRFDLIQWNGKMMETKFSITDQDLVVRHVQCYVPFSVTID